MTKEKVTMSPTMSPPWFSFFREIEAMFKNDPEITIRYVADPIAVKIYVDNPAKADALEKLLPKSRDFGGTTIYIDVVPSNTGAKETKAALFRTAFEGNPAFSQMIDIGDVFTNPIHYCVFKKEVVQYWDDNLGDPHGNISTLYQNIAYDIFKDTEGVIFCTDNE